MNANATIDFQEFDHFTTNIRDNNGFKEVVRHHPDFGQWQERTLMLNHIRIYEHRANLSKPVNVSYGLEALGMHFHLCISLAGAMSAHFRNTGLSAHLNSHRYHQLYIPENEYMLGFDRQFKNVHIEIDRTHFTNLLGDSERWSNELRRKISDNKVFYPGEHTLTPQMVNAIHEIFNSPLSGSLKQLLIEAKVHELIALQLNSFSAEASRPKRLANRDLFYGIYEYLAANYLKEHTLRDISRNFGINEFALKKGFKENFQTTVFDFLLSKRLEHAREQLLNTTTIVNELG